MNERVKTALRSFGPMFLMALAPVLAAGQEPPGATDAKTASAPIPDDEALAFGRSLAEAFQTGDSQAANAALDIEAVLDRATRDTAVPAAFREGFLTGARRTLAESGNLLVREFQPKVQAGAVIRATRVLHDDKEPRVLLRMIQADGVVAYIEFLIDRRPDGRIRAYDYYALATGELGSQTIRRLYLSAAREGNRSLLQRLVGSEQALVAHLDDLKAMATANREGRPEEVLAIYDRLPESLQHEKVVLLQRYAATQQLGDDAKYLAAIQDIARFHPDDPSSDFLLIDGYIMQKQLDKALGCIDRLDRSLGDAYLKVLRGNLLARLDRKDDARAAYLEAIAQEPDLQSAYNARLDLALDQKRFDEVGEALDGIENKLGLPLNDLRTIPEFADFLASPEGKAWAEKRAEKKIKPSSP